MLLLHQTAELYNINLQYTFPHINYLPFLVKSYIGFNNFCYARQNKLKKFPIPVIFYNL